VNGLPPKPDQSRTNTERPNRADANKIQGVDFHPESQQIAWVDTETGELQEQRLLHREAAEAFYRELATRSVQVRIGMEASGHARWFEGFVSELGFALWIGDAAQIRAPAPDGPGPHAGS
jgi:transposase